MLSFKPDQTRYKKPQEVFRTGILWLGSFLLFLCESLGRRRHNGEVEEFCYSGGAWVDLPPGIVLLIAWPHV